MELTIRNFDNAEVGKIDLAEEVFGLPVRADILARVVDWQLAKRRAGTHKVKSRSEISRTGGKMYRQKGTGRARHSSRRVVQFRGGGVVHGPQVRSHAHDLPKKVRKLGLKTALSSKQSSGKLVVLDSFDGTGGKTAELAKRLAGLGWNSVLFIGGSELDDGFKRAASNLIGVHVLPQQGANVYDILRRDVLVLSQDAVQHLEARLK